MCTAHGVIDVSHAIMASIKRSNSFLESLLLSLSRFLSLSLSICRDLIRKQHTNKRERMVLKDVQTVEMRKEKQKMSNMHIAQSLSQWATLKISFLLWLFFSFSVLFIGIAAADVLLLSTRGRFFMCVIRKANIFPFISSSEQFFIIADEEHCCLYSTFSWFYFHFGCFVLFRFFVYFRCQILSLQLTIGMSALFLSLCIERMDAQTVIFEWIFILMSFCHEIHIL